MTRNSKHPERSHVSSMRFLPVANGEVLLPLHGVYDGDEEVLVPDELLQLQHGHVQRGARTGRRRRTASAQDRVLRDTRKQDLQTESGARQPTSPCVHLQAIFVTLK